VAYGQRAPTVSGCVACLFRPWTRRDHKDAMTPLVVATSWAMAGLERQSCGVDRRAISVVAGARNHLQANRSLGFCFEILI
jgi:hypothetical protein